MPPYPNRGGSAPANTISTANSTDAPLGIGGSWTGQWEDVSAFDSLVLAVATDQAGTYQVQFSPDGTNADSTLSRYYRTGEINAPHRFTITRRYARVVFMNTSGSAQTYLRLQTVYGVKQQLNAPLDSVLSRDFDSTPTRPTDYRTEVALGLRQRAAMWNKFGYNNDFGTTPEVAASWGGTFFPMTTARTLSIVSTDTNDTDGGTGAQAVVIYGLDASRRAQVAQYDLTGTTPVVTAETWLGINRIAVARAGTGQANAGTITATATTDLTTQGQIPAGSGTSQQCIFHTQDDHKAVAEWLRVNVIRVGSGAEPVVTIIGKVYSPVSNCVYEVYREEMDGDIREVADLSPPLPFVLNAGDVFWLELTSTLASTSCNARMSLVEYADVDA